jgi:prepilin-type N-terminal cleavage/methylation domain-containing protein/prepilin-type processing-associated H-X9-DG protein
MKRRAHGGGGYTLVELLVVMAIIAVLASLILPAMARARGKAQAAQCVSNLRQWSIALAVYVDENDDCIPRRGQGVQPLALINRPEDWFNALPPVVALRSYEDLATNAAIPAATDRNLFVCPNAKPGATPNFLSYAMNMYVSPWIRPAPHRLQEIPRPDTVVFLADGPGGYSSTVPSSMPYSVQARHGNRANLSFLDGHIDSCTSSHLGCGVGDPHRADVQWQTGAAGVNQAPVP